MNPSILTNQLLKQKPSLISHSTQQSNLVVQFLVSKKKTPPGLGSEEKTCLTHLEATSVITFLPIFANVSSFPMEPIIFFCKGTILECYMCNIRLMYEILSFPSVCFSKLSSSVSSDFRRMENFCLC